jgi:F-box protein 11
MSTLLCPTCGFSNTEEVAVCTSCGSPLTGAAPTVNFLHPGTRLLEGAYTAGKSLGQGGFGITYLGSDVRLARPVAIKEFFPAGCIRQGGEVQPAGGWNPESYEDAKSRFLQEGQLLARFNHPGIVRVFTTFEENGTAYLVMEYLRGKSLGMLAQESGGKLPEAQAVNFIQQVGQALETVHQEGLLHRDIKPDNIMVTADGRVVLIDFGTAKEYAAGKTQSHTVTLTPGYAPLEQYAQRAHRAAFTDVYALAATLYHLVTGQCPVPATDRAIGVTLPPVRQVNPQVGERVAQAVMQGLALEVNKRPQSVRDFLRALSGQARETFAPVPDVGRRAAVPEKPVVIVSQKGQGQYRSINEAIKEARPGTRIMIRAGVYQEGIILYKSVELVGDGRLEDIVVESLDSSCLVMRTAYALVRGLTLRCRAGEKGLSCFAVEVPQGRLLLEDCDISSDSLSCIGVYSESAEPQIRRCQIHDAQHAGVFFYENASGLVEDCDIFANCLTGVQIIEKSNPVILGCRIYNQKQTGLFVHSNAQGTIEDCEIYGNAFAGVEIKQAGNPVIRRCRIHNQKQCGMLFHQEARGTVEECDIYGDEQVGIEIREGADPVIRLCRIHDEEQSGIFVHTNALGTIEDCTILENGHAGINISLGSKPVIRRCKINRNGYEGIWVQAHSGGTVEDCDLTDNARGAWDIEPGCFVERSENKEED